MDVISRGVIVVLGITGVAYAIWLLRECLVQKCEAANITLSRWDRRSARIDRFLELSSSMALMIVAGGFLVMGARDALLNPGKSGTDCSQQIPGMQPLPARRVSFDASLAGQPIVGADLSSLPITDHDVRALIRQSPKMWWLNITDTNVTDACLVDIDRVPHLTDLSIGHTAITDSGLKQVAYARKLEVLSLAGVSISDTGLESLSELTNLRELDLRGTRVTDAGMKSLHQLHRLEFLFVQRTAVTSDGIRDLAMRLPSARIDIAY